MVLVSFGELNDIYSEIKSSSTGRLSCSIMIFVVHEIDAMASTRMLTQLLRSDNLAYTLVPISDVSVIRHITISADIKTVFLINCGASLNVAKIFELEQGGDIRCYILDSHRPFHLANIYSRHNIVVFAESAIEDNENDFPSDGSELSCNSDSTRDEFDDDDDNNDGDDDDDNNDDDDDDGEASSDDSVSEENYIDEVNSNLNNNDDNSSDLSEIGDQLEISSSVNCTLIPPLSSTPLQSQSVADPGSINLDESGDKIEDVSNRDNYEELVANGEDDERIIAPVRKRQKVIDRTSLRHTKLRTYYRQNYFLSTPTFLLIMNLVLGRSGTQVPMDVLWQGAICAFTQLEQGNISLDVYNQICDQLRIILVDHTDSITMNSNYTITDGDSEFSIPNSETGNISEGFDFRLFLHRHWTIYESTQNSPYMLIKLGLYKNQGILKLQELFAKIGLPLDQAQQSYHFITPALRHHIHCELSSESTKREFNFLDPDIEYRSFFRHNSFKTKLSASDVSHAASALLSLYIGHRRICSDSAGDFGHDSSSVAEEHCKIISESNAFNDAYDCMGVKSEILLRKGIQAAILIQTTLVRKVCGMLENFDAVTRLQKLYFAYAHRSGHSVETKSFLEVIKADYDFSSIFFRPSCLQKMAQLIMAIKISQNKRDGGWTGNKLLPLFMLSEADGKVIIFGFSPLNPAISAQTVFDDQTVLSQKKISNFRLFYKLAAKETNIKIKLDCALCSNACEISSEDVQDFMGNLDYLFKKATSSI